MAMYVKRVSVSPQRSPVYAPEGWASDSTSTDQKQSHANQRLTRKVAEWGGLSGRTGDDAILGNLILAALNQQDLNGRKGRVDVSVVPWCTPVGALLQEEGEKKSQRGLGEGESARSRAEGPCQTHQPCRPNTT